MDLNLLKEVRSCWNRFEADGMRRNGLEDGLKWVEIGLNGLEWVGS